MGFERDEYNWQGARSGQVLFADEFGLKTTLFKLVGTQSFSIEVSLCPEAFDTFLGPLKLPENFSKSNSTSCPLYRSAVKGRINFLHVILYAFSRMVARV